MPAPKTSSQILDIARTILVADGLGAVSFDAIARRLGKSKQAVLYWFPTKPDLLAAMFLPWVKEEAAVAEHSVLDAKTSQEAISGFVRSIARFHLDDLDRFRMMYLLPQTVKTNAEGIANTAVVAQIHPVTDRLYASLADKLPGDDMCARRAAVAIHSSVLGLVLMFGLADGLNDPLKHAQQDLIDALVAVHTGPLDDKSGR